MKGRGRLDRKTGEEEETPTCKGGGRGDSTAKQGRGGEDTRYNLHENQMKRSQQGDLVEGGAHVQASAKLTNRVGKRTGQGSEQGDYPPLKPTIMLPQETQTNKKENGKEEGAPRPPCQSDTSGRRAPWVCGFRLGFRWR